MDTIKDFNAPIEQMLLLSDVFNTIPYGQLSEAAFTLSTETITTDTRIIYDRQTGAVSYDADGSDTAFSAIQFATLLGRPNVSETNFYII